MIVIYYVVSAIAGLLSHQTDRIISEWNHTPIAFKRLTRYSVGMTTVIVMYTIAINQMLSKRWCHMPEEHRGAMAEDSSMLLIMVTMFVGIGVGVGYVIDELWERFNEAIKKP